MDVWQLAAQLAKRDPSQPLLFISAYDAHLESATLPGPILAKPFRAETLVQRVNELLTPFPDLTSLRRRLCAELPRLDVIPDGEVIAIDDEGRMDFWGLMKGRGHLAYAAFDILWLKGKDLRKLPLIERKKRLQRLLPEAVGPLNVIPWFEEDGRELFQAARQYDIEGIVAKRKADPYHASTRWLKIKNPTYNQAEGRRELFEHWGGASKA